MRLEGLGRHRGKHAIPDPGGGLRQRNRVHQRLPVHLVQKNTRSPSPDRGRRTRTTAATSSRRTGQWYKPWSATTARHCPELFLLNEIWQLQSKLTNYFQPQQKLISKVRTGAKVSKKYDTATTPFRRAIAHPSVPDDRKAAMTRTHALINPAAIQRQIQAVTARLLTMTTSKRGFTTRTRIPKRAQ